MNPDSIIQYVRWMELRHDRLRDAVQHHRASKTEHAIPGSIDDFDRELWKALELSYQDDE